MTSKLKHKRIHTLKTSLALLVSATLITALAWNNTSFAEEAKQHKHEHANAKNAAGADNNSAAKKAMPDSRLLVELPESVKTTTMADMRKHLQGIQEIQAALGKLQFAQASKIAKDFLGRPTSHEGHAGPYMPAPMRQIGQSMHQAADQFSVEAENANSVNDLPYTLEALSKVTQACVKCHSAYRFQ